jgi:penicillin-binding protein 1A
VEIWSRVMRTAHQGVPVASLPGTTGGTMFSGFFGGGGSQPTPPAPVQPVAANGASTTGSGGLDNWFLNTLFGRR